MVNIFLEMTKKVGIFMIISQTVLHLGIAKRYEKYIRLVISFMVAAQIIFSFAGFFKVESNMFLFQEDFRIEWRTKVREFEEQLDATRKRMENSIKKDLEEYNEVSQKTDKEQEIQIEMIKVN